MQLRTPVRAAICASTIFICFAGVSPVQSLGQAAAPAPAPQALPTAPTPATPPAPLTFPKPNPANFNSDSPTVDTINSFLKASWGFDPNRAWQVEAILKTPVAGVTKVVVAVGEKGTGQPGGSLQFFVLPDGKHLIADEVLPFGANPFELTRKMLAERATGPARGAASKDLLFVEFSDFQCPHCKDAQVTVNNLLKEFPNAHFIYENLPLTQIHSEAYKAASYGVCVAKLGGDDVFFKYADEVFVNQASLTPGASDKTLKDAATKVGVDADKVTACSTTPATKAAVDASVKLSSDLGVNSTPTLYVNGRALPLGGPEDQLKTVIAFQMTLDGITPAAAH